MVSTNPSLSIKSSIWSRLPLLSLNLNGIITCAGLTTPSSSLCGSNSPVKFLVVTNPLPLSLDIFSALPSSISAGFALYPNSVDSTKDLPGNITLSTLFSTIELSNDSYLAALGLNGRSLKFSSNSSIWKSDSGYPLPAASSSKISLRFWIFSVPFSFNTSDCSLAYCSLNISW